MLQYCKCGEKNLKLIISYLSYFHSYYARNAIENPDSTNLSIFRAVSLWLANATEESVVDKAKTLLIDVPSYKLIDILPQLSARIGDANANISEPIFKVLGN
jgi:hypothetical protein